MLNYFAYLLFFGVYACGWKAAIENNSIYLNVIFIYCIILIKWFQFHKDVMFYLLVSYLIYIFFPYLQKPSKIKKYYRGYLYRDWSDKLIYTSYIYLLGSVYALISSNYRFGLIAFITCIGSTFYHRNKEMNYFNLDNIFATSLLLMFLYTLISSYYYNEIYFIIGAIGLPVSLFLLRYCGMPADITFEYKLDQIISCKRFECSTYDTYHTLWHISSGLGPILSVWYLNDINNIINTDGINIYNLFYPNNYTVEQIILKNIHILSLIFAIIVNILGNYIGIMPID